MASILQQRKHQVSTWLVLCEGNPIVTDGFPSYWASNTEIVSMSWHHYDVISNHRSKNDKLFCSIITGIKMTINHIIFHPFGACWYTYVCINTLRQRQDGRHFADYIFKCIFLNENVWTPIEISQTFVPKGPVNNIPAFVQIKVWRWPGDKPLFESMMVSLLMYECITRPQWVNTLRLRQNGGHFVENIFKSIFL